MEKLPGNSFKSKVEEKLNTPTGEIKKVVTEKVVINKATTKQKVTNLIFAKSAKEAGNYVLKEIVLPEVKGLTLDIINNFFTNLIQGDGPVVSRSTVNRPLSNIANGVKRTVTNYGQLSTQTNGAVVNIPDSVLDFQNLTFASRTDAQEVLDNMFNILESYEVVLERDVCSLAGLDNKPIYEKWGWTNLSAAKIIGSNNNGWTLVLPRPMNIK